MFPVHLSFESNSSDISRFMFKIIALFGVCFDFAVLWYLMIFVFFCCHFLATISWIANYQLF